jgi:hypothetical protein
MIVMHPNQIVRARQWRECGCEIVVDARGTLQDEVRRICLTTDQTAFMITHDVDEAIYLADRIVPMTNGPGAEIAELVENPLPKERRRADIHRHPGFYAIRNRRRCAAPCDSQAAPRSKRPRSDAGRDGPRLARVHDEHLALAYAFRGGANAENCSLKCSLNGSAARRSRRGSSARGVDRQPGSFGTTAGLGSPSSRAYVMCIQRVSLEPLLSIPTGQRPDAAAREDWPGEAIEPGAGTAPMNRSRAIHCNRRPEWADRKETRRRLQKGLAFAREGSVAVLVRPVEPRRVA